MYRCIRRVYNRSMLHLSLAYLCTFSNSRHVGKCNTKLHVLTEESQTIHIHVGDVSEDNDEHMCTTRMDVIRALVRLRGDVVRCAFPLRVWRQSFSRHMAVILRPCNIKQVCKISPTR